jgi:hypothetical protein
MPAPAVATDLDALRLRSEFLEMPGLVINALQAARLLDVRAYRALELLNELAGEGFLVRLANGSYRRTAGA